MTEPLGLPETMESLAKFAEVLNDTPCAFVEIILPVIGGGLAGVGALVA